MLTWNCFLLSKVHCEVRSGKLFHSPFYSRGKSVFLQRKNYRNTTGSFLEVVAVNASAAASGRRRRLGSYDQRDSGLVAIVGSALSRVSFGAPKDGFGC